MDVLTTRPLPLAEWLSVIEREYLTGFVPAGGAAVKLAIVMDDPAGGADDPAGVADIVSDAARDFVTEEGMETVAERLVGLGRAHGLLTVRLAARSTRVHMLHELFFAIARALPWHDLAQRYVEAMFTANAYPWPYPGRTMSMAELAASFAVAPSLLARQRDQWLTAGLWEERRLAQDFRAAMLRLCLSRLDADGEELAAPVLQWLHGEKLPAATLRTADIATRITRTSARAMLASLCRFVRLAGVAGVMVVLDIRQLTAGDAARKPAADKTRSGEVMKYSAAAVMDGYEVLRELIDDAEHLPGLFMAVLADAALATGDPRRALSQYPALQMRVWPDVRPGDRQNPVAPLVWLAA